MPQAWQGEEAWRVLDTGFAGGSAFFATWQAWAADPGRPRMLHYVAITPVAPERDTLLCSASSYPALAHHASDLTRQWFGLMPGFHRLALDHGRVMLTLCIGPLQAMLREQQFVADAVYLGAPVRPGHRQAPAAWDRWAVKALSRLCRRGTCIAAAGVDAALQAELARAGFVPQAPATGAAPRDADSASAKDFSGHYQPAWEPGQSRQPWRAAAPPVSSCVVVGAGLAGATAAAALARRGWQVTVLDSAAEPAAGASGLPVGLLAPQVSRDDSTRSRLSRAGVRQTLQLCRALLQPGDDWSQSGVMELLSDVAPTLPGGWSPAGRQWSDDDPATLRRWASGQGLDGRQAALWHAAGGWVKPKRLVQACLAQPGVRFVGNSKVHAVLHADGQWLLLDAAGRELARAPQVVVAGAADSVRLLRSATGAAPQAAGQTLSMAPMGVLGGQISWALQAPGDAAALPAWPVNGHGSLVAQVPMQGGLAWFAGASYEPDLASGVDIDARQRENLQRLAQLLPAAGRMLAPRFEAGQVHAWRGSRCTTADRLPAVGPLGDATAPGLWVSTGMGSRGLTYAVLCAELLAARLGGEPLPMEARLAQAVSATRRGLLAR